MRFAVVIAVGPRHLDKVCDTVESLLVYAPDDCTIILVDDCTSDGTYNSLLQFSDRRLQIIRNPRPMGYKGLVHSIASGFKAALSSNDLCLVLKTDTDALLTGSGLFEEALQFASRNPHVGIFGRHLINYDGTSKSFAMHTWFMRRELRFPRRLIPGRSGYAYICRRALKRGWGLGENIFGGAYFVTAQCLKDMQRFGYLDTLRWPRTAIPEDVYFTMCSIAAGHDRAHFAAPLAPLALAFDGLPAPASTLAEAGMRLVHTVDKGRYTSREENEGLTPREFFASLRKREQEKKSR